MQTENKVDMQSFACNYTAINSVRQKKNKGGMQRGIILAQSCSKKVIILAQGKRYFIMYQYQLFVP